MPYNPDAPPDNQLVMPSREEELRQADIAARVSAANARDAAAAAAGQQTNADIVRSATAPGPAVSTLPTGEPNMSPAPPPMAPAAAPAPVGGRFAQAPQGGAAPGTPGFDTATAQDASAKLDELRNLEYRQELAKGRGTAGKMVAAGFTPQGRQVQTQGLVDPETQKALTYSREQTSLAEGKLLEATDAQERARLSAVGDEQAQYAREQEENRAIGRLKLEAIKTRQEEKLAQIEQMKIDPHSLYKNKSVGEKLGLALAVGFGALGAAFTHGPNYALDIINKAQSDEIDSQIKGIEKAKGEHTLLQQAYLDTEKETGSSVAARAAAHELALAQIGLQAQQLAMRTDNPVTIRRNELFQEQLRKKRIEYAAEYEKAAYGTRSEHDVYRDAHTVGGSAGTSIKRLQEIQKARLADTKEGVGIAKEAGEVGKVDRKNATRTFVDSKGVIWEAAPGATDEQINAAKQKIDYADKARQTVAIERTEGPGVIRRLLGKVIGTPGGTVVRAGKTAAAAAQAGGSGMPSESELNETRDLFGSVLGREPALDAYARDADLNEERALSSVGARRIGRGPIQPGGK